MKRRDTSYRQNGKTFTEDNVRDSIKTAAERLAEILVSQVELNKDKHKNVGVGGTELR